MCLFGVFVCMFEVLNVCLGFCLFGFFVDGEDTCLRNKTCPQANRQHCSVEISSPAAYCEEIQEN